MVSPGPIWLSGNPSYAMAGYAQIPAFDNGLDFRWHMNLGMLLG